MTLREPETAFVGQLGRRLLFNASRSVASGGASLVGQLLNDCLARLHENFLLGVVAKFVLVLIIAILCVKNLGAIILHFSPKQNVMKLL